MNIRISPEYWMRIAVELAKAATCRANVGCLLVHENKIVGHGYVGSVHGDVHCYDDEHQLTLHKHLLVDAPHRGSTETGTTCIRTVHAEINAALKCIVRGSKEGGWIECYCTYQPCLDCTKVLLQIGVRKMYFMKPYKDEWRDTFMANCTLATASRLSHEGGKHMAEFIHVTI